MISFLSYFIYSVNICIVLSVTLTALSLAMFNLYYHFPVTRIHLCQLHQILSHYEPKAHLLASLAISTGVLFLTSSGIGGAYGSE